MLEEIGAGENIEDFDTLGGTIKVIKCDFSEEVENIRRVARDNAPSDLRPTHYLVSSKNYLENSSGVAVNIVYLRKK